jgi:LysM repeat protein
LVASPIEAGAPPDAPQLALQSDLDEPLPTLTALPQRPSYAPGELVDYIAQAGDTLPALSVRFNTTIEEIRQANPIIPDSATTMPPGMPMKIPIYYAPFWGSQYQILPDSLFINGPAQIGFDTQQFIDSQPGWLKGYREYASGDNRQAGSIVDLVALKFSVSPRLLLALLEYQSGALSQTEVESSAQTYPMGKIDRRRPGLYRQLLWAANQLNDSFYRGRLASQTTMEHEDGRLERFDPWQNAGTVGLQIFFNTLMDKDDYQRAIAPDGFAAVYQALFGDPWANSQPHIPASLEQPPLRLPFTPGKTWAYTGGPHTAWGNGLPWAALDFAPPLSGSGCQPTDEWVTALADGVVVRTDVGEVLLDLDGDGDERTGWVIFYLHVGTDGRAPLGAVLKTGDPIGHPSCEGGSSTGTHVHIARKYNGEWVPAEGVLAFNLQGWVAYNGSQPYQGLLKRNTRTVTACDCSNQASFIEAEQ